MRRLLLLLELPLLLLAWPVVRLVGAVRRALRRRAWPRTLDAAVDQVLARCPDAAARAAACPSPDAFATAEAHGLGAWVRLELGLWQGNDALLASTGQRDGDRACVVILEAVHRRVCGRG